LGSRGSRRGPFNVRTDDGGVSEEWGFSSSFV
jgi:hypothetical protein